MLLAKALAAWLLILGLAVANGALREAVLMPMLGRTPGLMLSGIALSLVILAVAYGFVRVAGALTARQTVVVGVLWLALTLAFEFGFGRYVQHKSWTELAQAYAFKDGNLWPLVLLVTLLAPWLGSLLARDRPASRA